MERRKVYDQLGMMALTLSICGVADEQTGKTYFPSSEDAFNLLRGTVSLKQYIHDKHSRAQAS